MKSTKWFKTKYAFILLVMLAIAPVFTYASSTVKPTSNTIATSTVTSLTNIEREALGLKTLKYNSTLQKAAQMKADDMAKRAYFSHTTPDGKTPWYWFDEAGYNFMNAGENLAVNFTDATTLEKAWMNSPTHKANIVNKDFKEIGIGIAYGMYKGVPTTFVVQMFGTEFSKTIAKR